MLKHKFYFWRTSDVKVISFFIWNMSVPFPDNAFTGIHLKQQEIFLDVIFSLEVFLKRFKNWQVNSEHLNKKTPCVQQLDFHPLDYAKLSLC